MSEAAITEKLPETKRRPSQRYSAWPGGVACASFFLVSLLLFRAYGLLRWKIIRENYRSLENPLKADLFRLLSQLEIYHLTALLAVGFGVWAFRGEPLWMRWGCMPLAFLSLLMFMSLM